MFDATNPSRDAERASKRVPTITLVLLAGCLLSHGCTQANRSYTAAPNDDATPTLEVVPAAALQWTALNPARGDQSPQAATLWGDRSGEAPTGFLVRFLKGFSSPPHIHNVSYRGVVIRGLVHNDHPAAPHRWMPTGSYWTQPKGGVHITAAQADDNIAFIEIDEGPYLVQPPAEAFDSGEQPVNVHASNLVWLNEPGTPQHAHLWRKGATYAALVRLPANFRGQLGGFETLRAVVIEGQVALAHPAADGPQAAGSFVEARGEQTLRFATDGTDCLLYLQTKGKPIDAPALIERTP